MNTESWLTKDEMKSIYSSDYWNEREIEKDKIWNVNESDSYKLLDHLQDNTNLEDSIVSGVDYLEKLTGKPIGGVCLDLAAGVCWTSAIIAKYPSIKKVIAVEISKHRLEKIAPVVIKKYDAPSDKIQLTLGNFCDIKLDDESVDLVILAQAFHHTEEPEILMKEIHRVLKMDGCCLITGENPVSIKKYFVTMLKHNIKKIIFSIKLDSYLKRKLTPNAVNKFSVKFNDIFPPDSQKGDHCYRIKDIKRIMNNNRYKLYLQSTPIKSDQVSKGIFNYIVLKK